MASLPSPPASCTKYLAPDFIDLNKNKVYFDATTSATSGYFSATDCINDVNVLLAQMLATFKSTGLWNMM